jgi:hypothetical protein
MPFQELRSGRFLVIIVRSLMGSPLISLALPPDVAFQAFIHHTEQTVWNEAVI